MELKQKKTYKLKGAMSKNVDDVKQSEIYYHFSIIGNVHQTLHPFPRYILPTNKFNAEISVALNMIDRTSNKYFSFDCHYNSSNRS